ncbi:MAG: hypothetical protein J7M09_00490 [Deltaproteobacteria bacterium]|nr:hypothetical protein [Candidatus Tharpella sp.]
MSRKSPAGKTTFQTLTYSRAELPPEPAKKTQDNPEIIDFHLPTWTKSNRGTKGKSSPLGTFKTFNFSSVSPIDGTKKQTDISSLTTKELDKQRQEIENEKLELLMHARGEAVAIVTRAEKETKKKEKELKKKAQQEGIEAAASEIKSRLERFDELLERLTTTQEMCRQKHEEEMVKLALTCARRLINREISLDESVITDCVHELFQENSIQGSVTLLLNSEDLKLINEQRAQLLSDFPQIQELKIEVDEGIERGGCILESSMGRIDASLRSKFEELKRLLL